MVGGGCSQHRSSSPGPVNRTIMHRTNRDEKEWYKPQTPVYLCIVDQDGDG
jgi:hypothetical protein